FIHRFMIITAYSSDKGPYDWVASQVACQCISLTTNALFSAKKDHSSHDLVNFYTMPVTDSQTEHISEIEAALLDAELFMKYQAPDKAIKRLKTALEMSGRALHLRER